MTISWLHISDIHECDNDRYHRTAMYEAIIQEVKKRTIPPDVAFITGDLSFQGTDTEYESLIKRFINPLKEALPLNCPIFTVPGNHDVDRTAVVPPRLWMTDTDQQKLFQDVGSNGQRKRQQTLLPRFEAYRKFEHSIAAWGNDWLNTELSTISHLRSINGKNIAIVGINTAWLCHDNEDWGKLTAGRTMVDAALREAEKENPDLIVVLGHHPLASMTGEKPWSDGVRIRTRLEQANAIYLHGHLHTSGAERTGASLQSILTIQAPSAFQAADSLQWRNGLMWGKVNHDEGSIYLEPLKWNDEDREYKFDTDAGLNKNLTTSKDAFQLPLPGGKASGSAPRDQTEPNLPIGWRIVNKTTLAEWSTTRPDIGTMVQYFDGSIPTWPVAMAEGVRSRQIVEDTVLRFQQHHIGAPRPSVDLFTGAGGEGKSTAILQVAAALVRHADQNWTCLFREAAAAQVPQKLFENLPYRANHAWIVVIDDAENAGKELAEALRHIAPRTDVHLLLAARAADWDSRGLVRDIWRDIAAFRQVSMPALDETDARRIIESWHAYGETAMGKLRYASLELAAKALAGHARDHAARPGEGALLGALLATRDGEELKDRVRSFIAPLAGRGKVNDFDLRDIYAMIAAMHTENQLYLSRQVLAFALGCNDTELDTALRILRHEAMLDSGDVYLLTRHRRIAEVAYETLRDDGYDVGKWYPYLASCATKAFLKTRSNPDIATWTFKLAEHFVAKGVSSWPTACNVARALYEADPKDPLRMTAYSKILRLTGNSGQAMALLKTKGKLFQSHRGVLYEWSVIAGMIDDHALDVWLAARSLADGGHPLSNYDCKLSLAGLGRAFEHMYTASQQKIFSDAQRACGRLGLLLPELDATTKEYFTRHIAASDASQQKPTQQPEMDLQLLKRAIAAAADEMEPDNDPGFFEEILGDPNGYGYTGILRIINKSSQ